MFNLDKEVSWPVYSKAILAVCLLIGLLFA